VKTKTKTFR